MLNKLALLVVVVSMARDSVGYPEGPPVVANPEICMTMMPAHDGNAAQPSGTVPYEIIASGDCYKAGTTLKVRVRIADIDVEDSYFEGFFILARPGGVSTSSVGTFDAMGDEYMEPLTCFGSADNGIGHSGARHYLSRTFEWTAPATDMGDIDFVATIVKNFETIWTGVSISIQYDASCAATNVLADEMFDDIDPDDCASSASHAVGSQEACTGSSISAEITVVFGLVAMAYKLFA